MSDPLFDDDDDDDDEGNTPLTSEERAGLIPSYVTLRRELNEVEHINIEKADQWAFSRRTRHDLLDEGFLRELHKRMYGDVWKWAGEFRATPRNIGVEAYQVGPDLRVLLDDVRYWIEHNAFAPDEIAVRFHHRLVFIHPFPNGNGRFSRLAADMLAVRLGQRRFSWGSDNLVAVIELRRQYIDALRLADNNDIQPLLVFARS